VQRAGGELLHGLLHSHARDCVRVRVVRKGRRVALRDADAERDDEFGMLVGLLFDPACVPHELCAAVAIALGGDAA